MSYFVCPRKEKHNIMKLVQNLNFKFFKADFKFFFEKNERKKEVVTKVQN